MKKNELLLAAILFISGCSYISIVPPTENYRQSWASCVDTMAAYNGNQIDDMPIGHWCANVNNLDQYLTWEKEAGSIKENMESMKTELLEMKAELEEIIEKEKTECDKMKK